jgi:hypothetical protein
MLLASINVICQVSADFFGIDILGNTIACPADCLDCRKVGLVTQCLTCGNGKTLNGLGNCVWPEIEGCDVMDADDGTCDSCKNGYFLDDLGFCNSCSFAIDGCS